MNKIFLFAGAATAATGSVLTGLIFGDDKMSRESKIGHYLVGAAGILTGIGIGIVESSTRNKTKKEEMEKEED